MMFVYYKCYISIELMFVKEQMFIKQVHQKSVIFVTIYFLNYSFKFQSNVCNRCHNLLTMSMKLSDIAISNIRGSNYRCIVSLVSENEAINLMQCAAKKATKNPDAL